MLVSAGCPPPSQVSLPGVSIFVCALSLSALGVSVLVLVLVSVAVPASPAPYVCDNAKSIDVLGNA